jgi:hypothetical protein
VKDRAVVPDVNWRNGPRAGDVSFDPAHTICLLAKSRSRSSNRRA